MLILNEFPIYKYFIVVASTSFRLPATWPEWWARPWPSAFRGTIPAQSGWTWPGRRTTPLTEKVDFKSNSKLLLYKIQNSKLRKRWTSVFFATADWFLRTQNMLPILMLFVCIINFTFTFVLPLMIIFKI